MLSDLFSEFFSDGFSPLVPGSFICYSPAQLHLSEITVVTAPSDLSLFSENKLMMKSKIRQYDILAS